MKNVVFQTFCTELATWSSRQNKRYQDEFPLLLTVPRLSEHKPEKEMRRSLFQASLFAALVTDWESGWENIKNSAVSNFRIEIELQL